MWRETNIQRTKMGEECLTWLPFLKNENGGGKRNLAHLFKKQNGEENVAGGPFRKVKMGEEYL